VRLKAALVIFTLLALFPLLTFAQQKTLSPDESKQEPQASRNPDEQEVIGAILELIKLENEAQLFAVLPNANKDKTDPVGLIAGLYRRSMEKPLMAYGLIGYGLKQYFNLRAGAQSAMQVSQAVDESSIRFLMLQSMQNQKLIEQNQRIIELLEQLVKKRP
jgi:hypothetical protein